MLYDCYVAYDSVEGKIMLTDKEHMQGDNMLHNGCDQYIMKFNMKDNYFIGSNNDKPAAQNYRQLLFILAFASFKSRVNGFSSDFDGDVVQVISPHT